MRALLHILFPLVIISLGLWGYFGTQKLKEEGYLLFSKTSQSKKTSKQRPPRRKIIAHCQKLTKEDFTVHLQSQGVVRPHNATTLTSQVSGRITEISPSFEDGAFFKKNDVLLRLDTADYLTALENAKARLAKAQALLAQEEARAKQALLNWKDAGFKKQASNLVLRKPQLRDAKANVIAMESAVQQATRNLNRTEIRAPYDGRVRQRKVGLGQQIGASTALGEIFASDFAEVRLPLTTRDLQYYSPPTKPTDPTNKNSVVFTSILNISSSTDAPLVQNQAVWKGTILRTEGELDTASRQLFVIARIDDPFGLKSSTPPLYIGQPVHASIPARVLKEVTIIPRKALSDVNEVIIIREGKIKRFNIHPIWSGKNRIAVRDAFLPNDLLCVSRLSYAPEGAPVEIVFDNSAKNEEKNSSTLPKKSKKPSRKPKKSHHH